MELTTAQLVNRCVEESIEQVSPDACQWAVFPHGTIVMFTAPAMGRFDMLASRAIAVLQEYGVERDTYKGIKPIYYDGSYGFLVDFASKFQLPRGVQILGVFGHAISTRGAIADMRLAPSVANCYNPTPPSIADDESDDESDDDSDVYLSGDADVELEGRFRSCDPRSTTVDARWVRDPE